MKLKVYLSCVIDVDVPEGCKSRPNDEIAQYIVEDDILWDVLGEGNSIYAKKCVVRVLEDIDD